MVNTWTTRELRRLRSLVVYGMSDAAIAESLIGHSAEAVRHARRKLGLRKRLPAPSVKLWTPKELALAASLAQQGYSRSYIAKKLGRTRNSVIKKLWAEANGVYRTTSR